MIGVTAFYLALTGLVTLAYLGDVLNEPSGVPPGDSLMALDAMHLLGYLVLLATMAAVSWRLCHRRRLLGKVDAVVVTGVLAALMWLAGRVQWGSPSTTPTNPVWLIFCCALPGVLGSVMGTACIPRTARAPWRTVALLAGALVGATICVWPIEVAVNYGGLVNVRGLPQGYTRETLVLNLAITSTVGTVSPMAIACWYFMMRGRRNRDLAPSADSPSTP